MPALHLAPKPFERPDAVLRLLARVLDRVEVFVPNDPIADHAPVLLIGTRTRDGYDWFIVCRTCGCCSLPLSVKPTRPICQVCSDTLEGRRQLAALERVVDGASCVGDIVIEG